MTTMASSPFSNSAHQKATPVWRQAFYHRCLAGRVLAGKFIDVVGRKKLLFGGLILFLLGSVFYLFALNLGFLMAVRFIHGIGFGISTTV